MKPTDQFHQQVLMTLLENFISFSTEFPSCSDQNESFLHSVKWFCWFLQYFALNPKSRDYLLCGGGTDDRIALHDRFKTFPEASEAIKTFCAKNFHPIMIMDSHKNDPTNENFCYKEIVYACVHRKKRASRGKRICSAKIYSSDCPFRIKLRLSRHPMHYMVTFVNLNHTHEVGPSIYCQYSKQCILTEDQRDFVREIMMTSTAKNKEICRFVQKFMNKNVIRKDISNLRSLFMKHSNHLFNKEGQEVYIEEIFVEKWIILQSEKKSEKIQNADKNQDNLMVSNDNANKVSSVKSSDYLPFENRGDQQLALNDCFKTYPEASHAIKNFCAKNFHPVKTVYSHINDPACVKYFYRDMYYGCVHYGTYVPKGTGIRNRKVTISRTDCPFIIKLSLTRRAPAHYRIFYLNLNHNHEIGPSIYAQYFQDHSLNAGEKDFVKEMMLTSDAQNKDISLFVQEFMNKTVPIRYISNIRYKFKRESSSIYKQGEQKYVKEIYAKKWKDFQAQKKTQLSNNQEDNLDLLHFTTNESPNLSSKVPVIRNEQVLNTDNQEIQNNVQQSNTKQTVDVDSNQGNPNNHFSVFSSLCDHVPDVCADISSITSNHQQLANGDKNQCSQTNVQQSNVMQEYIQQTEDIYSTEGNQTNNSATPSHIDIYDSDDDTDTSDARSDSWYTEISDNEFEEFTFSPTNQKKIPNSKSSKSERFVYARSFTDKLAAALTQFGTQEYKTKLEIISLLTKAWQQKENVMFFKEENKVLTPLNENYDPVLKHTFEKNFDPKFSPENDSVADAIDDMDTFLCDLRERQGSELVEKQPSYNTETVNCTLEIESSPCKKNKVLTDNTTYYSQNNLNCLSTNNFANNLPLKGIQLFSLIPFNAEIYNLPVTKTISSSQHSLTAEPVVIPENMDILHDSHMNIVESPSEEEGLITSFVSYNERDKKGVPSQNSFTAQSVETFNTVKMNSSKALTENCNNNKKTSFINKISNKKRTLKIKRPLKHLPKGLSVDKAALSQKRIFIDPVKGLAQAEDRVNVPYDSFMDDDVSVNNSLSEAVQISSVISLSNEGNISYGKNLPSHDVKTLPAIKPNRTEVCTESLMDKIESACNLSSIVQASTKDSISCGPRNSINSYKILTNVKNSNSPICYIQNASRISLTQAQKNTSLTNKAVNTILIPKVTYSGKNLSSSKNCLDKSKQLFTLNHEVKKSSLEMPNQSLETLSSDRLKNSSKMVSYGPHPNKYPNFCVLSSASQDKTEISISDEPQKNSEGNSIPALSIPLDRSSTSVQMLLKSKNCEDEDTVYFPRYPSDSIGNLLQVKQEDDSFEETDKSSQLQNTNTLLTVIQSNRSIYFSKDEVSEILKMSLYNKLLDLKSNLTVADIEDIVSENMLNDKIINIGQVLVKIKFPKACGLQDVLLGSALKFKVVSSRKEFVQVIHCVSYPHWITVSTYNASPGVVFVYNSVGERVPKDAVPQICNILNMQSSCLTVISKPMQLQTNAVDCGLFALANAITILSGKDPSQIVYDVNAMRRHLLSGVVKNDLEEFPTVKNSIVIRSMEITESFPLHCLCRQPLLTNSSFVKLKELYKCSFCKKIYHAHCKSQCCT